MCKEVPGTNGYIAHLRENFDHIFFVCLVISFRNITLEKEYLFQEPGVGYANNSMDVVSVYIVEMDRDDVWVERNMH